MGATLTKKQPTGEPLQTPESENTEKLTAFCKASADRLRLEILRALSHEAYSVLELCRIFATRQSGMSHHLKILSNARLVSKRREGNTIFYRRSHPTPNLLLGDLQHSLLAALDKLELPAKTRERIALVQDERAQASQQFFATHADKFREQQDLIANADQYLDAVQELLPGKKEAADTKVLEVGPGEGALLPILAQSFKRVIALDNSAEMLNKARAHLAGKPHDNIDFIHGGPCLNPVARYW
jgi:ArsR family transcriptional regulator